MYLRKYLTTPTAKTSSTQLIFWFSLSLTFAAMFGITGLQTGFSSEYVVQDDARQHVFWMRRFLDPELFPNDLIANYYQSIEPPGYSTLYQLIAAAGIDPLVLSKVLPPVLGLIATGYCFGICLQILPVPSAGFTATLLLNQNLWLKDDLVSGTPRAFIYPLFLAFLYYLLRYSLFPCLAAIALLGLFYPSGVLICAGILMLRLWRWERGQPQFSQNRSDYIFGATGLGIALLVLLPLALESSKFGAAITLMQAKSMPEFAQLGRTSFFINNPLEYWLYADRSGIFPSEWWRLPFKHFALLLCLGLFLPILQRHPSQFPLVRQITSNVVVLPQIALVSLGLFFTAHALLFKLYLPSRYTQYTFRILMAVAAAIVLIATLDAILLWGEQRTNPHFNQRKVLALGLTVFLGVALVSYPVVLKLKRFPIPSIDSYIVGGETELYKFFSKQPKDILIASLEPQGSLLPTFAKRSVLTAREYSIPYHPKYYAQIWQRTSDLINAQYSPDLNQLKQFIQKYRIDFWLLEPAYLFTPYGNINDDSKITSYNRWVRQFPVAAEADARNKQGIIPAISSFVNHCSVFEAQNLVVLQTNCITIPQK